jgi:hypothetical protein
MNGSERRESGRKPGITQLYRRAAIPAESHVQRARSRELGLDPMGVGDEFVGVPVLGAGKGDAVALVLDQGDNIEW